MLRTEAAVVLDMAKAEATRMADLLEVLVALESPSLTPESHAAVLDVLSDRLERIGYRVRRLAGHTSGGHLFAVPESRPRHRPHQLLLGHADTVWPVGTLDGAMQLDRDADRFRGPGAYDMKAGLVQIVFALDLLRRLTKSPVVTPVVFVNTDEEIGSRESGRHIARLAHRADRVMVFEPSLGPRGLIKTARKGIGRFTVTVHGQAAHAGLDPDRGASAILELSHVIQALFALNDPGRGVTVNVGTIDGGLLPNVVAPESKAVVDVRVPTQAAADDVERAITSLAPATPGTRLEIEGGIGRPPMEPTPGNRMLWNLAKTEAAALGLDIDEATAGGGSDANTTSLYAPTIDGMGAVGDGAHAAHEYVALAHMPERTALAVRLLGASALGADRPED